MEAIILAGGLGTRLRSVCPDLPKPLAPIRDKPFLSHLMHYWKSQGVDHFILSVGYLHEKIIETYGDSFEGVPIDYAIEKSPLGTGGALLHSLSQLQSPDQPFITLNGDTFFPIPLADFHLSGGCTLALHQTKKNTRYDGVHLSADGQITTLGDASSKLINGGCYLFHRSSFKNFEKGTFSLEQDLLPLLIEKQTCFGQPFDSPFIDIGIPEDYKRFDLSFPKN
ncbi:nucleotidyltransferase family protein [Simkania sp.]|uniref:nucleotidyltransferase family protein n=1 Tax=Simkania sp. TaxID=34094 RepID=UPI003B525535